MREGAIKIALFVVIVVFLFAYIGRSVPQIKSEPVQAGEIEISDAPDELVAAGKGIAERESSQCMTCHSITEDPKARCPMWENLYESAVTRIPGYSAAMYFVESVYNPNAFVVPGYPKNQMQPVNRPPIALSHDQIKAIICYLNSLGGTTDEQFIEELDTLMDPWRRGLLKPDEPSEAVDKLPLLEGDPDRGKEVFTGDVGCIKCHVVGNEGTEVGPELSGIGSLQTTDYIMESILKPSEVIVKGYEGVVIQTEDGTIIDGVIMSEDETTLYIGMQDPGQFIEKFGLSTEGYLTIPRDEVTNASLLTSTENDHLHVVNIRTNLESLSQIRGRTLNFTDADGERHRHQIRNSVLREVEGHTHTLDTETYTFGRRQIISPMPDNLGDLLTPAEYYHIVAFLSSLKGTSS